VSDHTLCIGDALVDLICERPIDTIGQADAFVPHFGGVVGNVAIAAAGAGARVSLLGGVGDDPWGRWLCSRLAAAGVDLSRFMLLAGRQTPVAFVAVRADGEPTYVVYGADLGSVTYLRDVDLEQAVEQAAALFITSNTLVDEDERAVTMRARELALSLQRPVIFDPNLRLHRWAMASDAAASANACLPGALLVRCNLDEAIVMTGEDDPERAALSLLKAGARLVVITLGADGAILRGELRADVPGVEPARVLSTIGAGDVLMGVLLARLAATGFYPAAVAAGLRDAVAAASAACGRWGALD
jgi:sugar/nucleoside kinase (ribokinase family)